MTAEWPSIKRIKENHRLQEERDNALKYAGTPDKPFVDQLTPEEEAAKGRILKARAEAAVNRKELLRKAAELGLEIDDDGDVISEGPRGGRYCINSSGRKSYDVP